MTILLAWLYDTFLNVCRTELIHQMNKLLVKVYYNAMWVYNIAIWATSLNAVM